MSWTLSRLMVRAALPHCVSVQGRPALLRREVKCIGERYESTQHGRGDTFGADRGCAVSEESYQTRRVRRLRV